MADSGVLYYAITNPRTGISISSGSIVFDAVMEESPKLDAEITQYPVERGVKPADHFQPQATRLSLKVLLTAHAISTADGGTQNANVTYRENREMETYNKLVRLRDEAVLLTYLSTKARYENMLIKNVSHTRTWDAGKDALRLDIELQQLVTVEIKRTTVKKVPPKNAGNNNCAASKDAGNKTGQPEPKQFRSKLSAITDRGTQLPSLGQIFSVGGE